MVEDYHKSNQVKTTCRTSGTNIFNRVNQHIPCHLVCNSSDESDFISIIVRKKQHNCPDGVAKWTERRPVKQRVASSIPSQGLGCGLGPQ